MTAFSAATSPRGAASPMLRLYDEALALTIEARDYIDTRMQNSRQRRCPTVRLVNSCETCRLTTRLTEAMAWLMMQRAVHEGEVTLSEAAQSDCRLTLQEVCLDSCYDSYLEHLHPQLQSLLERSFSLYRRIERLDSGISASVN